MKAKKPKSPAPLASVLYPNNKRIAYAALYKKLRKIAKKQTEGVSFIVYDIRWT